MAGLASLDVGAWDVPHDMVAQIHKGESVVPTTFAEGMRQSGGGGFGQGNEQGAGGDIHFHNHITAWDHSSVAAMVKSPAFRQTLVDACEAALLAWRPMSSFLFPYSMPGHQYNYTRHYDWGKPGVQVALSGKQSTLAYIALIRWSRTLSIPSSTCATSAPGPPTSAPWSASTMR